MRLMAVVLSCFMLVCSCAALQTAVDLFCNPSEAQVQASEAGLAFATGALAVVPGGGQYAAGLQTAVAVFSNIRQKICVTLPQLQQAISAVEAKGLMVALGAIKGRAVIPPRPDLAPLKAVLK